MRQRIRGFGKKRNRAVSIGPIAWGAGRQPSFAYLSSPGSSLVWTIDTGRPLNHCQKKTLLSLSMIWTTEVKEAGEAAGLAESDKPIKWQARLSVP